MMLVMTAVPGQPGRRRRETGASWTPSVDTFGHRTASEARGAKIPSQGALASSRGFRLAPVAECAAPQMSDFDRNVRSTLQMREYVAIVDRIAADGPTSILDWGCGYGQMTSLLRSRGLDTTAYEYRPNEADGALHPLEKYPEIEAYFGDDPVLLPYDACSFNAVLACGVLEHVENPDGSLDELHRVLDADGLLYVHKLPNARRGRSGSPAACAVAFSTTAWRLTTISTVLTSRAA